MSASQIALFALVAAAFGLMFVMIGLCFAYACFLTLWGCPIFGRGDASDDFAAREGSEEATLVPLAPAPLRHIVVVNPEGHPLFGYRLSDKKSSFTSVGTSVRDSFRTRTGDDSSLGTFVNPLMTPCGRYPHGVQFGEAHGERPALEELRDWHTM